MLKLLYVHRSLASLLALLFLPFFAMAEQVSGLYDIAMPVASQSGKDLSAVSSEGLKTVFIRVSGNAEVVKQKSVARAISRAGNYTRQFRYERRPGAIDESEQLWVVIEFEQLLIDQVLREAGLPLWSSNRPTVLVWMVVEDINGRRFVGAERDPDIIQAITANAKRRGLALRLPGLDLEDMVALSPDELWQLKSFRAQEAAERYMPDSILFGRVTKLTNGEWLGRWRYDFNEQQFNYDGEAANVDDYIGVALDEVAELMAAEYAIAPVRIDQDGVLMRLTGIDNFIDYARAVNYLEGIAAIRHANVVAIEGNEMIVLLVADGLLAQLEQAIALDEKLQKAKPDSYQGAYAIDLDYQWRTAKEN